MSDCTCADPQAVAKQVETVGNNISTQTTTLDETLYGKALKVKADTDSATDTATSSSSGNGVHGALSNIRFCHWTPPEYGSTGETLWTYLWQAIQTAIAIYNAYVQGQIADLQIDLAESYYQMAKDKWTRFETYYMPLEKELLTEVSTVEEPEMDCDDDRERAENAVNTTYDIMDTYLSQMADMYRICLDDVSTRQMNLQRSLMLVDTENYNLQDDQWFVDFKSDQRWARRSQVLNLGRNMGSLAMEYGKVSRALAQDVGAISDKVMGSLTAAIGYYGARFDTYYPTSYLSTAGQSNTALATANQQASNSANSGF